MQIKLPAVPNSNHTTREGLNQEEPEKLSPSNYLHHWSRVNVLDKYFEEDKPKLLNLC